MSAAGFDALQCQGWVPELTGESTLRYCGPLLHACTWNSVLTRALFALQLQRCQEAVPAVDWQEGAQRASPPSGRRRSGGSGEAKRTLTRAFRMDY
jgi:hypothetical protein